MDFFINNAILHIVQNDVGEIHMSNEELDIDSDICYEFISKHVKKLLSNPNSKEATFNEDSKVFKIVNAFKEGEIYFKDASTQMAEHLAEIMTKNLDIPPADVIIVQFETRLKRGAKQAEALLDNEYIAVLKLNYKEGFTHSANDGENGKDNQIVKCRNILPFENGKVEEACLIPYEPMVIRLLEKPYMVDGAPTNYFSSLFLECETELSNKEVAEILNEITQEMNEKYFENKEESLAKVKIALIDEAIEEEGTVSIVGVAARAFDDNEEAKAEFIELAKEAGIKPEVELTERFTRTHFGVQKFKASNGVEVKFPAELFDVPDAISFTTNEDGSISIVLNNLRKS